MSTDTDVEREVHRALIKKLNACNTDAEYKLVREEAYAHFKSDLFVIRHYQQGVALKTQAETAVACLDPDYDSDEEGECSCGAAAQTVQL